jgi:flagellar biosynthesis protein FlhF
MNVRKFNAGTAREALRMVRDDLGADAIILSNRQVAGKIEILAVSAKDVTFLTGAPPVKSAHPPAQPAQETAADPAGTAEPNQDRPHPALSHRPSAPPSPGGVPEPLATAANAPVFSPAQEKVVRDIVNEIRSLRGVLEGQLAGFAWNEMQRREPVKLDLLRQMLTAGFSPFLSRQLLEKMPAGYDAGKGLRWLKAALIHNLRVATPNDDIVERGGVYALVGPTGVGKTTTVAKLAARCTLKHGASGLGLITTDSYRIGAHEQLRIYGRILGVPVYAVKDEADLKLTLSELQRKHLVLIDTVGMSQRDRRVAEQVALLCGAGKGVKRLLLLNASVQSSTMEDVIRAYQGVGMDGCILTKTDEAVSIGNALDAMLRHKLTLHYVTNGQRVPEDLHLANPIYLVDRALKSGQESAHFALQETEYPLMMAAAGSVKGTAAYPVASGNPVAGI